MGPSRRPVVLVADDSELVRRIAENVLSAAGYRVVLAMDGERALAAARREIPDVVVLDLLMPHMTGFDVLREMKQSDRLRDTPVLVMSGVYKESVVGFLARLGAEGFIDKESLAETLAFRVRAVLERPAPSAGAGRSAAGRGVGPYRPEWCDACAAAGDSPVAERGESRSV
jgi:CheY-like chemotaxis protein